MNYKLKYNKYKNKYLQLKKSLYGGDSRSALSNHSRSAPSNHSRSPSTQSRSPSLIQSRSPFLIKSSISASKTPNRSYVCSQETLDRYNANTRKREEETIANKEAHKEFALEKKQRMIDKYNMKIELMNSNSICEREAEIKKIIQDDKYKKSNKEEFECGLNENLRTKLMGFFNSKNDNFLCKEHGVFNNKLKESLNLNDNKDCGGFATSLRRYIKTNENCKTDFWDDFLHWFNKMYNNITKAEINKFSDEKIREILFKYADIYEQQ